ncbi:hypothetical protein [Agromyces italicus]|uniref:hypothetical protein n=1 Tax=Agromyces italicus TaxID=279572 RepID=UPI0003B61FC5|nr:hypothetical protein [Agromyces italicus]
MTIGDGGADGANLEMRATVRLTLRAQSRLLQTRSVDELAHTTSASRPARHQRHTLAFASPRPQNGAMTVNDAQIWTVIGVLAAAFAGTIAVTTQLMLKAFAAQVGGIGVKVDALRDEMVLRFEQVDHRMSRVEGQMDRFESRLGGLESRFDALDRDVQAIARRVFPTDQE